VDKNNKFFQALKKKASAQLVIWKGAQNDPSEELIPTPLEEGNLFILGNSKEESSEKPNISLHGSKNPLKTRNSNTNNDCGDNKGLHGVARRQITRRKKTPKGFKWLNKREYNFIVKNILSQRQGAGLLTKHHAHPLHIHS